MTALLFAGLLLLVQQGTDRPSQPDFSGQWVLVESIGEKALVATELNVRQPVVNKNVYGATIPPGYSELVVDRTLPAGPRSDRYRLGTVSGSVSMPDRVTTRQSVTWVGATLVITLSQSTGTRIEEWQFNPQGQLVVTLTDAHEQRVPVATATYRRR